MEVTSLLILLTVCCLSCLETLRLVSCSSVPQTSFMPMPMTKTWTSASGTLSVDQLTAQNRDYSTSTKGGVVVGQSAGSGGALLASGSSSSAHVIGQGGQGGESPQGAMTYYYYNYPSTQGGSQGNGWGPPKGSNDDDDYSKLAMLLALKGLKGLKAIKGAFVLFKLLKFLLLPLLLLLLPLFLLLLLFIPIPVITMPAQGGRSFDGPTFLGNLMRGNLNETMELTHKILSGSECVRKLSCEMRRQTKGTLVGSLIKSFLDKMGNSLTGSSVDAGSTESLKDQENCSKFVCHNSIPLELTGNEGIVSNSTDSVSQGSLLEKSE